MKRLTLSLGLLLLLAATTPAADITPLAINSAAPDFSLPGVDGKNHALHDYDSSKILVVLFTCNHCPTAQAYEARIKQMYADYKDKGVALVAINPNNPQAVRLDELERAYVRRVLESRGGNKAEAARVLGINRRTLYRMLFRFAAPSDRLAKGP